MEADETRFSPSESPVHRNGNDENSGFDSTLTFGSHEYDFSFNPYAGQLTDAEIETIEALPSGSAVLLVRSGPTAGARYLVDSSITTIGRHPDAAVFLDDVTVSRRHAEITREADGFHIRDQRSLNGTYVNGERMDDGVLTNGSEIRVGKFRLHFYLSPFDLGSTR